MTIKVVQGLIGKLQAEAYSNTSQAKSAIPTTVQSSAVANSVVRDAVVVSFSKNVKPPVEKIGEYKEAKKVANDTAEKIKDEPDKALDAQGEVESPKGTGKTLL